MSDKQYRVTFEPQGRTTYVLAGTKVLEAAGRAGLAVETPCGGMGVCGKCRVQVSAGRTEATDADRDAFSQAEIADGWRLACQTAVASDMVVHIPEEALFGSQHQILAQTRQSLDHEVLPAVRKVVLDLPQPTLEDPAPDLLRIEAAVGPVKADLDLLRRLPGLIRKADFRGTAVLADHRLIDFEAGDTSGRCFGAAFDIGTTTLVASLLDLRTGDEKAMASDVNPQVRFGDDVLSRIQRASSGAAGAEELRGAIVGAINDLLERLCRQAGVDAAHIYEVSLAGNTTMQHLLCGIDVAALGQVPFAAAFARGLLLPASELGIRIHPRGAAYVFPVIGGFVGGDTVAGLLATRLTELEGPVLLVDIGTNGEIVVASGGRMWSSSTAAGPAFEGARISCGMRATAGAIEKVVIEDGQVHLSTIAGKPAVGLCGSGLIDAAADMLTAGLVTPEGRLLPPDELPPALSDGLRRRVRTNGAGQSEFVLAGRSEGAAADVALTQRDIRELQLAAGAIRAGIRILLRQAGLAPGDLKQVLIAGGFGSFIRRNKAQRIGLLPPDIDHRRIRYVGNTSLDGARWALLSTAARERAEQLARQAAHVQLSEDPAFQMEFAEAMIFPEGG